MKFFRLGIFFYAFILISCEKENNALNDEEFNVDPFMGTWEWVRSDGGLAFHIHNTPASTGKTVTYTFTYDMKYILYENGFVVSTGTFTKKKKKCIHSAEEKWFIDLSSPSDRDFMIEKQLGNDLETSDEAADGIGSSFKKVMGI
jgi:hypothetical protein